MKFAQSQLAAQVAAGAGGYGDAGAAGGASLSRKSIISYRYPRDTLAQFVL